MRSLLSMPLDPACRMIRFMLAEKGLTVRHVYAEPGDHGGDLAANNPALTIPVLIDDAPSGEEISVSPASAITEYLEEVYQTPSLFPATSAGRAEARRLIAWFTEKYEIEVNAATLRVKLGQYQPVSFDASQRSTDALNWHLDYISWLLENRDWLAGGSFSIADMAAASYLSSSDYLGLIPWRQFPHVKDWYARLKSRPSFQPILEDRIATLAPSAHYANLDF